MAYIGRTTDGFGVRQRFLFTPDAGATSVSGTDANGATLTFSDSVYMDVFLNGVLLKAGTDYNTNTANTIAGLTATVANDEVTVLVYDIFTTADMVSATSGGTFSGNVTHSGTVTVDDTTDSTSTTTGSIQTDGGLGVAKDVVIGDDLFLKSDSAVLNFGADNDINITHVADTGLTTNGDFSVGDDLKLNSDGAVLGFGADNDVTLTHVHNTGLRLEDEDILYFGADQDLAIQHTNSSSLQIITATSRLLVRSPRIDVQNADGSESLFVGIDGGAFYAYHNNTQALETTSGGGVTVANGLTLTDGDVTVASGHGINFAANTASSVTGTSNQDELLDHYEEGYFTPTIYGSSGSAGTQSILGQEGRYVKIGKLVYITLYFYLANGGAGSWSGTNRFGGLPFTNGISNRQALSIGSDGLNSDEIAFTVTGSGNYGHVVDMYTGAAVNYSSFITGYSIQMSGCYYTT